MKKELLLLTAFSCIQLSSYAYDGFGDGSERISNIRDALSEALCVDAVKDNKKISREHYLKLTMDNMNRLKMDYKYAKMFAEIVIKDAYRKCPEEFSR